TKKQQSLLVLIRSKPALMVAYSLLTTGMLFLFVVAVQLPSLLSFLGFGGPSFAGLFLAIHGITASITSFYHEQIKARISYRQIASFFFLLYIGGFVLFGLGTNVLFVVVALLLMGVGHGLIIPAGLVWITEISPATIRGKAVAYGASFSFLGQFTSPMIFGPLSVFYGVPLIFDLVAFTAIGFALIYTVIFVKMKSKETKDNKIR
ncbi:MAG: MFS transporter, partial [Candidatus Ranarchaeia archaeon]